MTAVETDALSREAARDSDQPVHLVEIDLLLGGHRLPMGRTGSLW